MNADLKRQLDEMGPEYHELVVRMKTAFEPAPSRHVLPYLLAASLVAAIGLAVVFSHQPLTTNRQPLTTNRQPPTYTVRVTDPHNEYVLATLHNDEAVKELIRTQRPDGSWKNGFLTRRNAAALKHCQTPEAQIAYKKAMRAIRMGGK